MSAQETTLLELAKRIISHGDGDIFFGTSMNAGYKRMLMVMQEKEKALSPKKKRQLKRKAKKKPWSLYILSCRDGSFYTGVTNNMERRLKMHRSGRASRYTRTRRPLTIIYQETCTTRTKALVREFQVKALPRTKKEALIESYG